jgi:hypothetical protein
MEARRAIILIIGGLGLMIFIRDRDVMLAADPDAQILRCVESPCVVVSVVGQPLRGVAMLDRAPKNVGANIPSRRK